MRVLLLGKLGQLGWELHRSLSPLGELIAVDYPEIDLSQPDQILQLVRRVQPALIVNATAYTAVDRAESEPQVAMDINARAPRILAEEARTLGATLIHFSTDYVFDGTANRPYLETDPPSPLSVYGRSKLEGERAIQVAGGAYLILRTSWVYSLRRDSFVTKVLSWARQQETIKVVSDQVGNPTWARQLAEITAQLLAKSTGSPAGWLAERGGLYHLAGSGYASRLEWAEAVLRLDPRREEQVARQVLPALTADFPTPARRPLFSALNCDHFSSVFSLRLPTWQDALAFALDADV